MPRKNKKAGGIAKRRAHKHRGKLTEHNAPLTPLQLHPSKRPGR